MIPYFGSAERQLELLLEIESWEGTRFWRGAGEQAKKGVGADCVSFAEKVLINVGAIQPIKWPKYVIYGGGDDMADLMTKTLDSIPELVKVWEPGTVVDPIAITVVGDVWFRSVDVRDQVDYHHLAIFTGDNTLVQMRERGLARANVHDRYAIKRLQAIYRAYEQPDSEGDNDRSSSRRRAR